MSASKEYFKLLDRIKNQDMRTETPLNNTSMRVLTYTFDRTYEISQIYHDTGTKLSRNELKINLYRLANKVYEIYATETQQIDPLGWTRMFEDFRALHTAKNAGYAGMETKDPWANFRVCERMGIEAWRGCMVRMGDKYIRIGNLRNNPKNEQLGENILDTLADLGAYALITICLLQELDDLPKKSTNYPDNRVVPNSPNIGTAMCPNNDFHDPTQPYCITMPRTNEFLCSCGCEYTRESETVWEVIKDGRKA